MQMGAGLGLIFVAAALTRFAFSNAYVGWLTFHDPSPFSQAVDRAIADLFRAVSVALIAGAIALFAALGGALIWLDAII